MKFAFRLILTLKKSFFGRVMHIKQRYLIQHDAFNIREIKRS